MTVVTAHVDSLAAQAAAVPGSDPATLQRIASLARDINAAYGRTEGMNMSLVAASSGKLLGAVGRGRGGGIGGFIYKFLTDLASKIGSDGMFQWFKSIGVSDDEDSRETAEILQGDNALKLHQDVEAACQSIQEIDATADTAISGVAEVLSALLAIVRIHPVGRVVGIVMPLVVQGMEQILGMVEDRNQQLENCLGAVTDTGRAMQEHQPAPPCEWMCPATAQDPCSEKPAPTQECDKPALAPAPASGPPAQGGKAECDEQPAPAAQPAPTVKAEHTSAEKCIERLVPAPAPTVDTVRTHTASAAAESPTNISFNFNIDSHTNSTTPAVCVPTCDDVEPFAPPAQEFSACHSGVLLQIGVSITLECLDYFAECLSQVAECPGEGCCTHGETPPGEPAPPAPEPAEEPCPEPPPAEDTPHPPPPDLAAVEEPPAPAEKLRAMGLEQPAPPPAEPAAPAPEPPPAPAPEPTPAPAPAFEPAPTPAPEPAPSGDTPKMRKTGEW